MKYTDHSLQPLESSKLADNHLNLLKIFVLLTLSICLIAISACSSQQAVKPVAEMSAPVVTVSEIGEKPAPATPEKIDDRLFIEGIAAIQDNDLTSAQQLFNEFIRNNPDLSGAYVNLALINFKQKKINRALEFTEKALLLNPLQAQAYQLRAQINIQNGKINAAKQDYTKAIEINPDYINAHFNLALLYDIYLQQIELAITHYEIYQSLISKPDEANLEWINHLKGTLKNG